MPKTYKFNKLTIRFETPEEKELHSLMSKIRYGEIKVIEIDGTNIEDRERIVGILKKSAFYNNMDVQMRWSKDFKSIRLTHEM